MRMSTDAGANQKCIWQSILAYLHLAIDGIFVVHLTSVTYLEQVVEHCAGWLPHEDEEAAEVDDDANGGERHDDKVVDAGVAKCAVAVAAARKRHGFLRGNGVQTLGRACIMIGI
jgi:hypothetical protein